MREMSLTKGKVAIVDDADYDWLNQWKWYATNPAGKGWRAQRDSGGRKSKVRLAMSRVIMGVNPGDSRVVDHINHNSLDNRRENLRIVTVTQNNMNVRGHRDSETGEKGVHINKSSQTNPYRVQIQADKKRLHIGCYPTMEAAKCAYRHAAMTMHGQFACTLSNTERQG